MSLLVSLALALSSMPPDGSIVSFIVLLPHTLLVADLCLALCMLSVLTWVMGVILLTGLNAGGNKGRRPGPLTLITGVFCASPLLVSLLKHRTT